jgi:hypothetical protein
MKKLILTLTAFLLLFSVIIFSCKKSSELPAHGNHGVITQDFRMCAMCGGYFVRFDNDTSTVYRTFQDLSSFGITGNTKFPLKATIGWKPDTVVKIPHFITITSLKINN